MSNKELELIDLDKILSLSLMHIYWLDSNNVYQGCNDQQAKTSGLKSRYEVVGKKNADLPYNQGHMDLVEKQDKVNLEVINTGEQRVIEEEAVLLCGKRAVFLSYKVPLKDDNEKVVGLLGISIDITQQKNREKILIEAKGEAEFTLENIISHLPSHIYWKDANSVYLGCNESQAKSLGLSSATDVIGKTDFDLPGDKVNAEQFRKNDLQVMQRGEVVNIEEESLVDNKITTVLSQKIPLRNRNLDIVGVVGISVDITNQKKIEQDLRIAKEKSEAANKAKVEFLRNMRHDFRTPFNGILGITNILYEEETDIKKKELLKDVINSSEILLEQLNEIEDFVALEEGGLAILEKQFDLYKVVDDVEKLLLPPSKNKKLELVVKIDKGVPQYIIGDKTRTHRILINLLTNAVKFTHIGQVSLQVSIVKQDQNKAILKFRIEDTGIGFYAEEQDIIFDKFSRLTPSYKGIYPGKGLGLRIVKQFLDELEGEIHVKSKVKQGTIFAVLIPYKVPLLGCDEKE